MGQSSIFTYIEAWPDYTFSVSAHIHEEQSFESAENPYHTGSGTVSRAKPLRAGRLRIPNVDKDVEQGSANFLYKGQMINRLFCRQ